jgi:hypothetical protein
MYWVMERILTLLSACLLAAVLALPGAALAQGTSVPPGNSEADQYFETVPDGKGNKSLDNSKDPADVLTPKQLAALEALGEDGITAAQLAAATAPDEGGSGGGGKGGKAGVGSAGGDGGADSAGGEDGTLTPAAAAPSRDGLGGLLWVIVIGVTVAGGTYALVRARARRGS